MLGASGIAKNELDVPVEAARAAVMGAGAGTEREGVQALEAGFQSAAETPFSVAIARALASSRLGCCRMLSWMFRKEGGDHAPRQRTSMKAQNGLSRSERVSGRADWTSHFAHAMSHSSLRSAENTAALIVGCSISATLMPASTRSGFR